MAEVSCAQCGSKVIRTIRQDRAPANYFCNMACKHAHYREHATGASNPNFGKRRGATLTCKACGVEFYRYPSYLTKPGRTNEFCSMNCTRQRKSEIHTGKVNSPETRAKISAARLGVKQPWRAKPPWELVCSYCDRTYYLSRGGHAEKDMKVRKFCNYACVVAYRQKNPDWCAANYRGGAYLAYGRNWNSQSKQARERDSHTCQECGAQSRRPLLDVHHIVSRRLFGEDFESANALTNLVTLCRPCHIARERILEKLWTEQGKEGGYLIYTKQGAELMHVVA